MSFWPVPDIMTKKIGDLAPETFTERGVRLLLLDVDNTLSPYKDNVPKPEVIRWADTMRAAGLELFILSNNRGSRPEIFARALGVGFVKKAGKPFTRTARRVIAEMGFSPGETALIGDQVYTDTLCARRLGAAAVLVDPIKFTNPFLLLRYWLEAPFRLHYKIQHKRRVNT